MCVCVCDLCTGEKMQPCLSIIAHDSWYQSIIIWKFNCSKANNSTTDSDIRTSLLLWVSKSQHLALLSSDLYLASQKKAWEQAMIVLPPPLLIQIELLPSWIVARVDWQLPATVGA